MPADFRKSVDLDEKTVQTLILGAASFNVSLKRYMEQILIQEAEQIRELSVAALLEKRIVQEIQ